MGGACVLTAVAVGAFLAGAPNGIVKALDLANSGALFAVALVVPKRFREQRAITLALGLSALGDLFLSGLAPVSVGAAHAVGIVCFLAAYLALVVALLHGRPHPVELLFIVPYLGIGTAVVWTLGDELTGVFLLAVPIFLLLVTAMAWSAATTLTRTHFVPRVRVWAAAGGAVLFSSDAAVALVMFHSAFQPVPPTAVQAFVRASYIAGWLLFLLIACDPVLRAGAVTDTARPVAAPRPTRR